MQIALLVYGQQSKCEDRFVPDCYEGLFDPCKVY